MRLLLTIVFASVFFVGVSQTFPHKFNYQAVARDIEGKILQNTPVTVGVSLLSGSSSGSTVFEEEHYLTTNAFGLFFFKIGEGTLLNGQLDTINWENQSYFLQVKVNGEAMAAEQLVAVPYAVQANNSIEIDHHRVDAANPLDGQVLVFDGASGTWVAQTNGAVNGDNWGSQTVVSDATLSGDGTASNPLSGFDGNYTSLTNQPTIPTLTSQLTNDAGFITTEVDGSITNELITGGNLSGSILQITDAGGTTSIDLSSLSGGDNWGTQTVITDGTLSGSGTSSNPLTVVGTLTDNQTLTYTAASQVVGISNGNTITLNVDDADANPTNEIQDLQLAGNILTITNNSTPTSIDLSAYQELPTTASTGDILKWNGTTWALSTDNVNDGDYDPANEFQNLSFSGNAVQISNGSGFNLSATVPTNNQVLGWNSVLGQWEAMNAPPNNLYNSDGTLAGDRVVTQAGYKLSFSSALTDGFNVGNNSLSVDGSNQRVGIGINTPGYTLDVNGTIAIPDENSKVIRKNDGADLLSAAYGFVNSDGSNAGKGTSNFTSSRLSSGVYSLVYNGPQSFSATSDIVFSATATDDSGSTPVVVNYRVTGTNTIEIKMWELPTTTVLGYVVSNLDRSFSFELRIK